MTSQFLRAAVHFAKWDTRFCSLEPYSADCQATTSKQFKLQGVLKFAVVEITIYTTVPLSTTTFVLL